VTMMERSLRDEEEAAGAGGASVGLLLPQRESRAFIWGVSRATRKVKWSKEGEKRRGRLVQNKSLDLALVAR
jgi:hypothetical protein